MDPTLRAILLTTLLSGIAGISAAAFLSMKVLSKVSGWLPGLSVGIMLSASLLHTLPEAIESQAPPANVFATLLAGLLAFFMLEKIAIMRGASHQHQPAPGEASASGWTVLLSDALHNFTDGVMISSAFIADPGLGVLTGLAIVAHEIPQEAGNFAVLLKCGYSRARAYASNLLGSLTSVLGGVLGYLALDKASGLVPYVLAAASAGFLYVAIRHHMPELQKAATPRETLPQLALVATGVLVFVPM